MKVAPVVKALSLAKPSLGAADSVLPILSHFCFMDDMVYAYNDIVATVVFVPPTGLVCGLHGDTLLGILEASGAEDATVTLDETGTSAKLDVSGGRVKVPALAEQDFIFVLPDAEPIASIKVSDELIRGMELCLKSVGNDSLRPEFAGVTFVLKDKKASFFSTNNETAARYMVADQIAGRKEIAVVIPPQACEQLIRLQKALGGGTIAFIDGNMTVEYETDVGLLAVLVSKTFAARADLMQSVFTAHADTKTQFAPIPAALARELKKATVVLARDSAKACLIYVRDGSWFIEASGDLGSMTGQVLGDKKTAGSVVVGPDTLLQMMGHTDSVKINESSSIVLSKGGYTGIISHMQAAAAKFGKAGASPVDGLADDIPY